jgi:hypothetical protein
VTSSLIVHHGEPAVIVLDGRTLLAADRTLGAYDVQIVRAS